ncbi:C-terminal processing protease CtpA/Prc, contains a PDZ domain [Mesonia phycicola]|uniref:C-terminal processing protease CtpA/Prc, contains a PDZ domain n=1 Tax=Mesonia phycicola TaxID=579105 RepID=A0A1M6HPX4_9FLAO|nr:S41 family peptidase [Mesonia phycicola]SHJ24242.1 C-terminal processing protease CtpA/Prc, contains a PDZ domain [Mesonia phycicola]
MKYILLLCLCFHFTNTFSQVNEIEKNEKFIKIWGLLKYYHPEISDGKFNFNKEFIKEYQKVELIKTKEAFDEEMIDWIESYGIDKFVAKENISEDKLFTKNYSFEWINESNYNFKLFSLLNELKENTNYKNYYAKVKKLSCSVDFSNETSLANFDYSKKEHRLLFLASFWNAMKFWNVNIYLTDTPWEKVLNQLISDFTSSGKENFEKAKENLFSKLNDSHSDYRYSYTLNLLNKFPNFGGKIINDSLVITSVYNKKMFQEDSLSKGDIIYAINGVKLNEYYQNKFSNVISVSNQNYLKRAIEKTYLLASNKDSILVNILKTNGQNIRQYIQLSPLKYPAEKYMRLRPSKTDNWKELNTEIGYINLNYIDRKQLKQAFNHFNLFKGVIIDLRNYPKSIGASDIAKHLYPEKTTFLKALTSIKPSYGDYGSNTALSFINNLFEAGKKNKAYFKGKIVLLVDRTTASKAEWIGMAIQASPNCTTIGEQTFGAVMNRNQIQLIDGTTIDFTGVGAFYPNNESVQRKGLRLDYKIKESALQYDNNLYIEKAIRLIN